MDGDIILGQLLEYREHHVLFSQDTRVFDLQLLGVGEKVGRCFGLKLLKMHFASGLLLKRGNRGCYWLIRFGLSGRKLLVYAGQGLGADRPMRKLRAFTEPRT